MLSNDMNSNNSASQHTRNNQTFSEITSNTTLPKINQVMVFIRSITSNK